MILNGSSLWRRQMRRATVLLESLERGEYADNFQSAIACSTEAAACVAFARELREAALSGWPDDYGMTL